MRSRRVAAAATLALGGGDLTYDTAKTPARETDAPARNRCGQKCHGGQHQQCPTPLAGDQPVAGWTEYQDSGHECQQQWNGSQDRTNNHEHIKSLTRPC